MAYVTPPSFSVGEEVTSPLLNVLSGDISALAASAFPSGVAGAVVGTAPTDLTKLRVQCGYASGTTDGSGNLIVGFPVTFPSGVIGVFPAQKFGAAFTALCEVTAVTTGYVQFTFINSSTGSAIGTNAVNVQWFAFGF